MPFDRRTFIGTGILATAATGGPSGLALFAEGAVQNKVMTVLKAELKLADDQAPIVAAFTESLAGAGTHHRSAEFFQKKMAMNGVDEELSSYIVQEFVASTNFLSYVAGHTRTLELIAAS